MRFESVELKHLSIFNFNSYRTFLQCFYDDVKKENEKYSIRYLSRKFEVSSPSTLNMILRGHRNPGLELTNKICKALKFSKVEEKYFKALVKLEKNKLSDQEKLQLQKEIKKINPYSELELINEDSFSIISNWYFFAIRQLIQLKGFNPDIDWIYKKLKKKVTKSKIKDALNILEKNNLIKFEKNKYRVCHEQMETTTDIPSEALKQHHEQMISLARESIREVSTEYRDIGGTTFRVEPEDLQQMKKEINDFRKYFYKKYEKQNGKEVYQVNMQLFPLTDLKED